MKPSTSLGLLLLIAIVSCGPAFGTNIGRLPLRYLIFDAELIFLGTVEAVDYRSSNARNKNNVPLPHTFVTFTIERILKGKTANDSITLRFEGGREKDNNGEDVYLLPSLTPLFDKGDQGILFVKGNGQSACPLVGLRDGRIRVIEGYVYSDLGHQVGISEKLERTLPFIGNDIIRPLAIFDRLLNPISGIDKSLASQLSKEVLEKMQLAVKSKPHSVTINLAKNLLAQNLNEITGINAFLNMSRKSIEETQLIPEMFPKSFLREQKKEGDGLRDETRRLLEMDRKMLSVSERALLNRLELEDLYPNDILRRLKGDLVRLSYNSRDMPASVYNAVMIHDALCVDCQFTLRNINSKAGRRDGVAQDPNIQRFKKPKVDDFLSYLTAAIRVLHAESELETLEPVPTAKIHEPFYVQAAKPVRLRLDLKPSTVTMDEQTSDEISEEERAMIKSGFNPVLRPPPVD